jgi:hypothetical protein
VLGQIQSELAKLIAGEIYSHAKQQGSATYRALKQTTLRSSGSGLPPPVLVAFENSFLRALSSRPYGKDGYAKWQHESSEKSFNFLFRSPLVEQVNRTDWAAAAKNTAAGVSQISALGSDDAYREAVAASIGKVFDLAVATYKGKFHATGNNYGWRVLSDVLTVAAAAEGTTDFQSTQLFYWSYGKEAETTTEYKLAKSLMTTGLLFKRAMPPSAGPFFP